MLDLHMHSTFSDGSLTPAELAQLARKTGIQAVALTDHDTTDGTAVFVEACRDQGVIGLAGVEISVDAPKGTLHMLGYGMDTAAPGFCEMLRRIRAGRSDRNQMILERLNALGLALTWEEVRSLAGEDVVGRPHFAEAMLRRGYIQSREEAFDRYLGKGKPAYVDRLRFSAEDSIRAIREAGGVAVLAHPSTLELAPDALRRAVESYAAVGLRGIEVYYAEHSVAAQKQYASLARAAGLILTGGSDFHGGNVNPGIRMGHGFGDLCVPDELLDPLMEAIAQAKDGRAVAGRETGGRP
jgi:predicted metal-dependent phosphoesterase TrpH